MQTRGRHISRLYQIIISLPYMEIKLFDQKYKWIDETIINSTKWRSKIFFKPKITRWLQCQTIQTIQDYHAKNNKKTTMPNNTGLYHAKHSRRATMPNNTDGLPCKTSQKNYPAKQHRTAVSNNTKLYYAKHSRRASMTNNTHNYTMPNILEGLPWQSGKHWSL